MEETGYIHGTNSTEQERLALLNRLTNGPFLVFLDLKPTDSVLEVGSGLGILAGEVAQRVPQGEVVGIEYSQEQLAKVQITAPHLTFQQGDAHQLPFEADRFDVAYCRYVLEHVRDPLQVLREMRRVLKPGGRAYTQENNMQMVVFDPDCPHCESLLQKFILLQKRLGGDALIGKRLFGLFQQAGFREITLSFQPEIHPANTPTFRPWLENALGVFGGAGPLLVQQGLATEAEVHLALTELESLLEREDSSGLLFHWNRAVGTKT